MSCQGTVKTKDGTNGKCSKPAVFETKRVGHASWGGNHKYCSPHTAEKASKYELEIKRISN